MFKKDIKTVQKLESALKKVYDRTNPEIIHSYLSAEGADIKSGRTHSILGCGDCPFLQAVRIDEGREHQYCLWDGAKGDISSFTQNGGTPEDCPLQTANITVSLNGNT